MNNSVSFVEFRYCYIVGQNVPVKVIHSDGNCHHVCLDQNRCTVCQNRYIKGEKQDGLNILETKSLWNDKRFVSNVVLNTSFGMVTGFENHNGRMDIGILNPLGEVLFGNGNNGEDKKEGVIYKNTFASYLDGPILPKNPKLCDEIIKRALIKKYNEDVVLKALDDKEENVANNYIVSKYTSQI